MASEISAQLGGGTNGILLDPPSQLNGLGWGYDIDGNTEGEQQPGINIDPGDYYKKRFRFSRAFVGANSVAGNQYLARTADESIQVDFGNSLDIGAEHFNVIKAWNTMSVANIDNAIYSNIGSYEQASSNGFKPTATSYNHNMVVKAGVNTSGIITNGLSQYIDSTGQGSIAGTRLDNLMLSIVPGLVLYTGDGRDNILPSFSTTVKDFSTTDKILMIQAPFSQIVQQNNKTILKLEKADITIEGSVSYEALKKDLDLFKDPLRQSDSQYFINTIK